MQDSSSSSKRICVDFNLENLPSDLGLREKILSYHPNNHDEIRRYYLQKDPCQPVFHRDDYPISYFFEKSCRHLSLAPHLNNLCLLRNTLEKIHGTATGLSNAIRFCRMC